MLRLLSVFVYLLSTYRYIRCKVLNYLSTIYHPYFKGKEMAYYRYGFVMFCMFGIISFCCGKTLKVILDYYGVLDYINTSLWLSTIWNFGVGFCCSWLGRYYGTHLEWELQRRWVRGSKCMELHEYKYKTKMNYDCMCYHENDRFLYKLNNINRFNLPAQL